MRHENTWGRSVFEWSGGAVSMKRVGLAYTFGGMDSPTCQWLKGGPIFSGRLHLLSAASGVPKNSLSRPVNS